VDGDIEILDNDGPAVVGLERTFYQVSEDVGVVEVCAIVYSPSGICPIAIPFDVALSTLDGTSLNRAVTPMDYGAVSAILMFAACDTRQCVNVPIADDETLELTETFTVTLDRTPTLDTRITLNPVDGDIKILDNDS
jgi:hypothetical protein